MFDVDDPTLDFISVDTSDYQVWDAIRVYNNMVSNGALKLTDGSFLAAYFKNNIFGNIGAAAASKPRTIWDYNLYDEEDRTSAPTGEGAHSFVGNPAFRNADTGDFTLMGSSDAIDAGIGPQADANAPTTDLAENTRSGSSADIGAHEYIPGSVRGPTSLSFYAPSVSPCRSARVYGWLKDDGGTPLSGKPIEIQHYSRGWKKAASVTTDANGRYLKTMWPVARTSYRAVFAGDGTNESKTSIARAVLPKARLVRSTSWSRLRRSKTYYARGYIEPRHYSSNGRVYIRAYKKASNGKYYYRRSFKASYSYYSKTRTRYRAAVKLTSRGRWKLVAYHGADSRNARTYSTTDYVKVR